MADETTTATTETTTTETTPTTTTAPQGGPGPSLIVKSESTETGTETTTTPVEYKRPDKFKTDADGWKAYAELESKFSKGLQANVPDKYDFASLKEHGVGFTDEAQQTEIETALKGAGISQDAVAKLSPVAKTIAEANYKSGFAAAVSKFGEPTDEAKETAALKAAWGNEYEAKGKAVAAYAKTLPPDLLRAPPDRTAAGMDFLYQMLTATRGADFINSESTTTSTENIQGRLNEIIADREYTRPSAKGEGLRAEAARLSKQLAG